MGEPEISARALQDEEASGFAGPSDGGDEADPGASELVLARADGEILRATSETNPTLAYLASLPSENSRRAILDALRRVAKTTNYPADNVENIPWWLMGPEHAGVIRARLLEAHYSLATVKLSLAALKGVLEHSFVLGRLPADRLERVRLVLRRKLRGGRLSEPSGRMLEDEEIARIRRACIARGPFAGAMYDALVALALSGGLRREELARAMVDDVASDGRTIRLVGKGNKEARVPLAAWASCSLDTWLAQRAEHDFWHGQLFVRINGKTVNAASAPTKWIITMAMRDISSWSGVKFTAHDLRRTFISTLAETQDVFIATSGARHSDPKTTKIYDRRPFERLAAAVEESAGKWGKL